MIKTTLLFTGRSKGLFTASRRTRWYALVLLQELRKMKFYAILRVLWDAQYRKDIAKLCRMLSAGPLTSTFETLNLDDIHFSHDINYPEWVSALRRKLITGEMLPPMKVMYDGRKYIVIDGNHRLRAMKLNAQTTFDNPKVRVRRLRYKL